MSSNPTTEKWFNTDVFTSLVNSTSTNATPVNHLRTLPLRFSDVRRDAINNIDLSLLKNVTLSRDVQLQLRAEFVNAFNHPYLDRGTGTVVNPTSSNFGRIVASNQANYARRAQLGVKLIF